MGSYSSVASLPAYLRMIRGPPGCSGGSLSNFNADLNGECTWHKLRYIVSSSVDNDPT